MKLEKLKLENKSISKEKMSNTLGGRITPPTVTRGAITGLNEDMVADD